MCYGFVVAQLVTKVKPFGARLSAPTHRQIVMTLVSFFSSSPRSLDKVEILRHVENVIGKLCWNNISRLINLACLIVVFLSHHPYTEGVGNSVINSAAEFIRIARHSPAIKIVNFAGDSLQNEFSSQLSSSIWAYRSRANTMSRATQRHKRFPRSLRLLTGGLRHTFP